MSRLGVAVRRWGLAVRRRDGGQLKVRSRTSRRVARIVTWTARGFVVHELSVRAAALTYYTLFSIVPVLVVVLWTLKLLHLLPHLMPGGHLPSGGPLAGVDRNANVMLREAARAILESVDRMGRVEPGLVGLGALLYGVLRLIRHSQRALDTIAGARGRPAKYWRLLGYLALLLLPPALLIVSGLLRDVDHAQFGPSIAHTTARAVAAVPGLGSLMSRLVALGIVCLALTIFYASGARARIALGSSVAGASVAALLLGAVLWAFTSFQLGVSRAGALAAGMAALPAFLLWTFFSWLVILAGAEIAVAHQRDRLLARGLPGPTGPSRSPSRRSGRTRCP